MSSTLRTSPSGQPPPAAVGAGHAAAGIEVRRMSKRFDTGSGDGALVLDSINLDIKANEFVTIVGRSGCGKTTLLNIIAGLLEQSQGEVFVNKTLVRGPGQGKGMVFQQHALFPWLTARENIAFGCSNQGMSKSERRRIVDELLTLVGLEGHSDLYPMQMSGGMQQRVAIARAMALDPQVLLMDEPFASLDEFTRMDMQGELLRIWATKKKTVVFVTHNIVEALVLSDRIIVLKPNPGRVAKDLHVKLERPRKRSDPRLLELYDEISEAL